MSREKIDLLLAKNLMTVADLANNYGVSRARINVIINQRTITPISAGRLAKALNADVTEIIE
ncbi:MAG: XRE family transcriptional regulator [Anaerostipes sp.]|nr:XRE family transcriptional regulator [Anaerostipes sp.]MDD3747492.1 XRE family transcriptional regulator [Anaerostipes sp.]